MSFGLDIIVDHGDGYTSTFEVVDGHTYNLSPMWRKALPRILENGTKDLQGRTCAELAYAADAGLIDIVRHKKDYEALNPPNGWGDFEGFLEIYLKFVCMVHEHPTGRIEWKG